jgi:phosphopantothenoylcysteine decarboxylase/phosphopantothenate--cysteine ligase
LTPTPKLISELRGWYPGAKLVGWKFEVDGNREDVIRLAQKQLAECHTDASVANGPAYGAGFGLVQTRGQALHLPDAAHLYDALEKLVVGDRE